MSSLVWWCVARDLAVAWSLGTCGCTSAIDSVDGKDAVLGMSCAVGTRPEVLGARQVSSWVGLPHGKQCCRLRVWSGWVGCSYSY